MSWKKKQSNDSPKIYKMERSPLDWEQIIQEAKKKEQSWKFMREEGAEEVDDIVKETSFNNRKLLDGTYTGISYQTGSEPGNRLRFGITHAHSAQGLDIAEEAVANRIQTASGASVALTKVNEAITTVSKSLQEVGATVSRLNAKSTMLSITLTNSQATRSRIIDADIAMEQLKATQYAILQQSALSQLLQANILPGSVLSLFRRR
ncbi:MAG: hypothetical protein M1426_05810 [Patescibacteria group bacterium]|nr:hypothetical protein [Patescibacteria group bacterium]